MAKIVAAGTGIITVKTIGYNNFVRLLITLHTVARSVAEPRVQAQHPRQAYNARASSGTNQAAAEYQVARVARARGLSVEQVREFVAGATRGRTFGIFGEPRVNVLELNLALDANP